MYSEDSPGPVILDDPRDGTAHLHGIYYLLSLSLLAYNTYRLLAWPVSVCVCGCLITYIWVL